MLPLRNGLGEFQVSRPHKQDLDASHSESDWKTLGHKARGLYLLAVHARFGRLLSVSRHAGALQACSACRAPASVSAGLRQCLNLGRLHVQEGSRVSAAATQPARLRRNMPPSLCPVRASTKCPHRDPQVLTHLLLPLDRMHSKEQVQGVSNLRI